MDYFSKILNMPNNRKLEIYTRDKTQKVKISLKKAKSAKLITYYQICPNPNPAYQRFMVKISQDFIEDYLFKELLFLLNDFYTDNRVTAELVKLPPQGKKIALTYKELNAILDINTFNLKDLRVVLKLTGPEIDIARVLHYAQNEEYLLDPEEEIEYIENIHHPLCQLLTPADIKSVYHGTSSLLIARLNTKFIEKFLVSFMGLLNNYGARFDYLSFSNV